MDNLIFPIFTMIVMFGSGIALGMYISSQLKQKIDKNVDESYDDDLPEHEPSIITKEDAFEYVDKNGNKLKIPTQNHTRDTSFLSNDVENPEKLIPEILDDEK